MYLGSYLSQFFTQLCPIIEYDENVYEALMNIRPSKRCHNRKYHIHITFEEQPDRAVSFSFWSLSTSVPGKRECNNGFLFVEYK